MAASWGRRPNVTLVNLAANEPVVASSQVTNGKDAFLGNDGQLSTEFCPGLGRRNAHPLAIQALCRMIR